MTETTAAPAARITDAQRDTMRRIRDLHRTNRTGHYEIAATEMRGAALIMFFDTVEVYIGPDGTYGSNQYGPEKWRGLRVGKIKRPVDLLSI
jgi:hypothetical protein